MGILKWIGRILLLAIIVAVAGPWWVVVRDWGTQKPYKEYLSRNVVRLDLSLPDAGIEFAPAFYENRLFLLGEIHGAQKAQTLDLALMRHLNERAGVRWLLAELDYAQAERFNAFLDTGDLGLIEPVIEAWLDSSTQRGNQQHFEKLIALRAFNVSRPVEERFRYFGVDRIQNVANAADWMGRLLVELPADAPAALRTLRDVAVGYNGDEAALASAAKTAIEAIDALRAEQDEQGPSSLAIDVVGVRHLALNLARTIEGAGRYELIEPNIAAMVSDFGVGDDESLYGFWGFFHVINTTVNDGARPLRIRLADSDLPFADDIVSISMLYSKSEQNMPSLILPESVRPDSRFFEAPMGQDNPYLMYLKGIGEIKSVAGDADAALFHLVGEGSPYPGSDRLATQSGILTKVFRFELDHKEKPPMEYILLIRDSAALTEYTGEAAR